MEIEDENHRLKIIVDNLTEIFTKDNEKLHKFLEEIKEDTNYLSNKLNKMYLKIENTLHHYELLFYEIGDIKKNLSLLVKRITQKTINEILIIKNPNDAIFLLMQMFYRIISNSEDKNISWEKIQSDLTFSIYKKYVTSIESNFKGLSIEELNDAMPFSINHSKIAELIKKFGIGMILILDFLKDMVEYSLKTTLLHNVYSSNIKKTTKVKNIQNDITMMSIIIKEGINCADKMDEELKEFNSLKAKDKNSSRLLGLNLIKRYKIDERYHVILEMSRTKQMKQKYIIRIKTRYKDRDSFLNAIIGSRQSYEEGKIKEIDQKMLNAVINSTSGDKYSFALDNKTIKNRNVFNYFYPKNFLTSSDYSHMNQGLTVDNMNSYGCQDNVSDANSNGNNIIKCPPKIKKLSLGSKGLFQNIKEMKETKDDDPYSQRAEKTQRTKGTDKEKEDVLTDYVPKNTSSVISKCQISINQLKKEKSRPVRERNNSNRLPIKQITLDDNKIEFDNYYCCK